MVAHPAGRRAAAAGGHPHLHSQFRHRLGALSVPVIHGRAAQHPRRLGVLPRCRRRARRLAHISNRAVQLAGREAGFAQSDSCGAARIAGRLRNPVH